MRKLKRFNIKKEVDLLTGEQMMQLTGGDYTYTCSTGSCKLYIPQLRIEVTGSCKSAWEGGSVRCYCQNGGYTTNPESRSSCWK